MFQGLTILSNCLLEHTILWDGFDYLFVNNPVHSFFLVSPYSPSLPSLLPSSSLPSFLSLPLSPPLSYPSLPLSSSLPLSLPPPFLCLSLTGRTLSYNSFGEECEHNHYFYFKTSINCCVSVAIVTSSSRSARCLVQQLLRFPKPRPLALWSGVWACSFDGKSIFLFSTCSIFIVLLHTFNK